MSKIFKKIAIIMLLAPNTIALSSCDNQEEVLDEKLDYAFILERIKNHLETGIDAKKLSSDNTNRDAFAFVSEFVKSKQSLINLKMLTEQPEDKLVVGVDGKVTIKIEITLGLQNFLIEAKLLNVRTPLTLLIEDMKEKYFKNGIIIDGSSLDNQQQFSSALDLIKKNPYIGSKDYNFILESSTKDDKELNLGQNKIAVIFKLPDKNYVETVEIIVKDVKLSPINAAFKALSLINNDEGLTMRHKTENFLTFVQKKITEFNKDLKVKSVLKPPNSITGTTINLNVVLEDLQGRTKEDKIKINKLGLFKISMLRDEIFKIITDNSLVFEIPLNDNDNDDGEVSDNSIFKKYFRASDNKNLTNLTESIKKNPIIQQQCSYDVDWNLVIISSSSFNTKSKTGPGETREIMARLKITGSSSVSSKIQIKYTVV